MKSETISTLADVNRVKSGFIDKEPAQKETLPTGPLKKVEQEKQCSLLIFVPRNVVSTLINDLSGGYGYSHLAVDCGELDIPTGKRVMVESTFDLGVHNSFQDEYGERKFVRIPLGKFGFSISKFCDCIRSKLGEGYDDEDALTMGLFRSPARQMCSDLATVCLPETTRREIAKVRRLGLLHHTSVSVHSYSNALETKIFISPNGFAQYYGAPKGEKLSGKDFLIKPHLVEPSIKSVVRKHGWKAVIILGIAGTLIAGALLFINKDKR
jgi:hypothetical protein